MATFSRKFLAALGIDEDKIEQIIERHSDVVQEIKSERDNYKESADQVQKLTDELKAANDKVEALTKSGGDVAKVQKEFDDYKAEVEAGKVAAKKSSLVRKALEDAKANPQAVELLMKGIDLDSVELDGDKLKDAEAVTKPIIEQYSGFFGTDTTKGTQPTNPPPGKNEPEDPFIKGFDGN